MAILQRSFACQSNILRLLDGFKIWLKSAWNAKSLPRSSLTLPPASFLRPFSSLYGQTYKAVCGGSGKEGGNCAREEETPREIQRRKGIRSIRIFGETGRLREIGRVSFFFCDMLHLPLYVRACTRAYWCEYVCVYVRVVRAFGRVAMFVCERKGNGKRWTEGRKRQLSRV